MRQVSKGAAWALLWVAGAAPAAEVTVKNDSVTDFSTAVIVTGFTANEEAAAWLTTPCDGNIRAAQLFWRSQTGTSSPQFGEFIKIHRSGTFPTPGAVAETIQGPLLTDGVINEYRFLDENNTVPLNVPVTANETFVLSFGFDVAPPSGSGPSVVRDTNGCQAGRNGIRAELAPGNLVWFSSCSLGVAGDWVIRAVVDCAAAGSSADLGLSLIPSTTMVLPGQTFTYTLIVANGGPGAANGTSILDTFPSSLENVAWVCTPSGGATCPTPATGTGNLNVLVNLPNTDSVTFLITATVAANATGTIANTALAFPPTGVTDPNNANNLVTANVTVGAAPPDPVFADSFEDP